MSMSILARSSVLRQQALARARSFHTTAPARSDHGHYHHLPFQFPGEKKASFAIKLALFMSSGFAIPFAVSKRQLQKSQGGA
ncbi:hypothetical protein D9615_000335 [Tricholomella constricta]|uniref:Cytochrome c oxidase subunit 8, mitochondrial n=1 Tax=Tricholomella constricta TaxID=117010 RepID=A0A8H5HQT8_9AGAR|nr:hypothetical protein D9615_000335 [Tricholomella constricta]